MATETTPLPADYPAFPLIPPSYPLAVQISVQSVRLAPANKTRLPMTTKTIMRRPTETAIGVIDRRLAPIHRHLLVVGAVASYLEQRAGQRQVNRQPTARRHLRHHLHQGQRSRRHLHRR
jgi:hypothetical protein